jgi:large subunit ribosomal protein L15
MSLAPHTVRSIRTKSAKRVGRGNGSQKGTTAARGTKGQKSRSGGRGGLKIKGLRANLLKVPKLRGFKSFKPKPQTVTLQQIDGKASAGQMVTPKWLASVGLIRDTKLPVKLVATGTLSKSIIVKDCLASKGVLSALEKAGGKIA